MAANVLITFEAETSNLEQGINGIISTTDAAVKAAKGAGQKIKEEFTETGKAIGAAFGSQQVNAALKNLTSESDKLTASLDKLQKEEVQLIATGQLASKSYKDNQLEQAKLRAKITETEKAQKKLNDTFGNGSGKAASLKAQLKEATIQLQKLEDAGQEGTDAFNELLLKTAQLRDRVGDLNERVTVLASDTFKFDVAVDAVQQLAGAFAVVQGAAALFGAENEDLQKTIAKTQGAIALLQGVQQLANFVRGQSAAKIAIENALIKINEASIKQSAATYTLFGRTIQFTSIQLNFFKAALAATGIGLVIVGVSLLIEKLQSVTSANERYNQTLKNSKDALATVGESIKALRDIQNEADTDLRVATKEITQAQADREEATKKVGAEVAKGSRAATGQIIALEREYSRLNGTINANESAIEASLKSTRESAGLTAATLSKENQELEKQRAKVGGDIKKLQDERAKLVEDGNATVASINAKYDQIEIENAKVKTKELIDKANKLAEERIRIQLNVLKTNQTIEGSNLANQIKIAEKEAELAKQSAKGATENKELAASQIALIEAELQQKLEELRKGEIVKQATVELQRIKNAETANNKILENSLVVLTKEEEIANAKAGLIKDTAEREVELERIRLEFIEKRKVISDKSEAEALRLIEKRIELEQVVNGATLQNETELLKARADIRKLDINNSTLSEKEKAAQILLINAQLQKDITQITIDEQIKRNNIELQGILTRRAQGKETVEDRIKEATLVSDNEKKELFKRLGDTEEYKANVIRINAELEANLKEIRAENIRDTIEKIVGYSQQVFDTISAINELSRKITENYIAKIQEQNAIEIEGIENSGKTYAEKQRLIDAANFRTARLVAKEKTRQATSDKALALFQAVINTASGIAKAIPNPALIALAAITGGIQIATIAAQPIPKFKKGGWVNGASHEAGGVRAELEGGEYVVKKSAASKYAKEIEAMNTSGLSYKKLIAEKYVKPSIIDYALSSKRDREINLKATLNSRGMEKQIKGLRNDLNNFVQRKVTVIKDTRNQWQ